MKNGYEMTFRSTFVVIGGGIAGVTCAETISTLCSNESIILITETTLVKAVTNLEPMTKWLFKFHIEEREVKNLKNMFSPTVTVIVDTLLSIDSVSRRIYTTGNRVISYKYVCICTGGRPNMIQFNNNRVIGIRDTDSLLHLLDCIKFSRKLVLVGNGGIASELAYAIKNIEIHWVIKDYHISSTFLDPGAAEFFQQILKSPTKPEGMEPKKRLRFDAICFNESLPARKQGAAMGPDWKKVVDSCGPTEIQNSIKMHYNAEITSLEVPSDSPNEFPLLVSLSTGEVIKCDFVVSATGVYSRIDFGCNEKLKLSDDGFIFINSLMETNINGVYAAGDVCSAGWNFSENWFQKRLWTQARQMGDMAGRSMVAAHKKEKIYQDFCFEIFGHATTLFGFDVILLGCFNGQKLGENYEILFRSTPGNEYIKFVLYHGRLRGAILIGNTKLAETCENLILNGLDLSEFGDDILNPKIDIEDFFD